MSKEFKDVIAFNQEVIKLPQVDYLDEERLSWFKRVINEELGEFEVANNTFAEAIRNTPAIPLDKAYEMQADMIDAIMDLIYFAYGRLYEIGVTPEDFECMWDAIQNANMMKKRGNKGRGSDNDAIKPEGWKGPEETYIEYKKNKNASQKQLDSHLQTTCRENTQMNLFNELFPKDTNIVEKVQVALSGEAEAALKSLDTKLYKNYLGTLEKTSNPPVGVKYDQEKPNLSLVFGGFAKALRDIGYVGTFGAKKYSPNGWKYVTELQERYMSALERHALDILDGKVYDEETGRLSIAHVAWNALALLQDSLSKMDYDSYNKAAIAQSNATLEKYFKAKKEQNNG